jgi:succinate dehydrogenase / fumarate reductase cytochrome b subunit
MLGSYYRFQMSSLLSITFRLTGIYLTLVTAPLGIAWLVALAIGHESYQCVADFMASVLGQALVIFSLFCLSYHLCNGIRHLVWDTGRGLSLPQVRKGGWAMLVASFLLAMFVWWSAS